MAYKESEILQANTPYVLKKYTFNCVFDDSPTLGTFARASMKKDDQTVYKTVSLPNTAQILGWTLEANEDTADVYAQIEYTIPQTYVVVRTHWEAPAGGGGTAYGWIEALTPNLVFATAYNGATYGYSTDGQAASFRYKTSTMQNWVTITTTNYEGIHVMFTEPMPPLNPWGYPEIGAKIDRGEFVYYDDYDPSRIIKKEILVGRFAIDLEDAGGVGPGDGTGGGWTDPGDYDEDWEEGDPTHTLYVTVTGALSGRHNDPIEDPSYSYIPSDKNTVKDYGCGGDGGHGGGGGAGASTVVIHKFATNQANSKEVTVIARRHGYGSGGGKGGKGGDGCILVYY